MATTIALILLVPFVAMHFSNEVHWSAVDFIVAGVLLSGTAIACELVLRKVKSAKHRIIICAVILLALILLWLELAVGIFGTSIAGS